MDVNSERLYRAPPLPTIARGGGGDTADDGHDDDYVGGGGTVNCYLVYAWTGQIVASKVDSICTKRTMVHLGRFLSVNGPSRVKVFLKFLYECLYVVCGV